MSNTINVNYMTRAYNQYQQKNAAKDQEKEDTALISHMVCFVPPVVYKPLLLIAF